MSKRTTFTTISPLPPGIARHVVLEFLHNHQEMIDLNPLVKERHCIEPPPHATSDEFHCTWYSLTDRISYLPGGLANGHVTYTCAFHHLANGIQTHCYAPAGLNIRDKWTLNGSLPGEPIEPVELGTGAPVTGLYIREEVDMRCSILMASFVKKTLKKSHAALIERLKIKAAMVSAVETKARGTTGSVTASSSISLRSDISGCSSRPPSVQRVVPQLPRKSNTPIRIPPPYNAQPCAPPWDHVPPPQKQNASPTGPTAGGAYKPSEEYPPRGKPHSPPSQGYGRYGHGHPLQPQPPKYQYLQRQQPSPLVPAPLRLVLRQDPASIPHPTSWTRPNKAGNTAAAAPRPALQAAPSVRYRAAHPDYPQMNPYTDEMYRDRQVRGQDDLGRFGSGVAAVTGGPGRTTEATLRGPFVAELEG